MNLTTSLGFKRLPLNNELGSVLLPVCVLILVLAVLLSSILDKFRGQTTNAMLLQSQAERAYLIGAIQIAFSDPAICAENLTSDAFGTSLSEIRSRSDRGRVRLNFPGSTDFDVFQNQTREHLRILNLGFTPFRSFTTPEATHYLTELEIAIQSTSNSMSLAPISVPFYLGFKNGRLVSCQSSFYVENTSPPQTIENSLCNRVRSSSVFNPSTGSCGILVSGGG